jgi:hypothetical protein
MKKEFSEKNISVFINNNFSKCDNYFFEKNYQKKMKNKQIKLNKKTVLLVLTNKI